MTIWCTCENEHFLLIHWMCFRHSFCQMSLRPVKLSLYSSFQISFNDAVLIFDFLMVSIAFWMGHNRGSTRDSSRHNLVAWPNPICTCPAFLLFSRLLSHWIISGSNMTLSPHILRAHPVSSRAHISFFVGFNLTFFIRYLSKTGIRVTLYYSIILSNGRMSSIEINALS